LTPPQAINSMTMYITNITHKRSATIESMNLISECDKTVGGLIQAAIRSFNISKLIPVYIYIYIYIYIRDKEQY